MQVKYLRDCDDEDDDDGIRYGTTVHAVEIGKSICERRRISLSFASIHCRCIQMSNIRLAENLNGNMKWMQELGGVATVTVVSTCTIRFYVYVGSVGCIFWWWLMLVHIPRSFLRQYVWAHANVALCVLCTKPKIHSFNSFIFFYAKSTDAAKIFALVKLDLVMKVAIEIASHKNLDIFKLFNLWAAVLSPSLSHSFVYTRIGCVNSFFNLFSGHEANEMRNFEVLLASRRLEWCLSLLLNEMRRSKESTWMDRLSDSL